MEKGTCTVIAGCTAKRIVIPMVLLYIKSRVRLISRKRRPTRHQVSEKGVGYLPYGPNSFPPI